MDAGSLEVQTAVYARYLEVMKVVISFQGYVLRKHFNSGLVVRFPAVILHPINFGKVSFKIDEKRNEFHVYAYGKTTDTVGAYIDMYVGLLEGDLMGKNKRVVKLDRFKDANTDWRQFTDILFAKMIKYIQDQP